MARMLISACAAAVAVAVSATGAYAGQAPGAGAVSDGFADVAARLLQSERAALGPSFAGAWLDGETVRVGFADKAALAAARRDPRLAVLATGAQFVERKHSTADLDRALDDAVAAARAEGVDYLAAVNIRENVVDLTVERAVSGVASDAVRVTVGAVADQSPFACDTRTTCALPRAGVGVSMSTGGVCTQGFTVQDAQGKEFATTAGHCGQATFTTNNRELGTTTWRQQSGSVDAQVINVRRSDLPKLSNLAYRDTDRNTRIVAKIGAPDAALVGQRVCSESRSGSKCGNVDSTNVAGTFGGIAYTNLGRYAGPACRGDSGGPVVAVDTAYGFVLGGPTDDPNDPNCSLTQTYFVWGRNFETASNYTITTVNPASNFELRTDQKLTSPDGRFEAVMQADGNFVVYGPAGATWATATNGNPGAFVRMQDDGNLVVYRASGGSAWASNTNNPGRTPERLTLDNTGFLGMYVSAGYAIWGNGTDTLYAGQQLGSTKELKSKDKRYTAAMQWDGNFVVYGPNGTVPWASHTVSSANYGAWAQMQNDGNFVMYRPSGPTAICASNTAGNDYRLVIRDDGNLVVSNATGTWFPWQTAVYPQPTCPR